jgi:spore coat protein H
MSVRRPVCVGLLVVGCIGAAWLMDGRPAGRALAAEGKAADLFGPTQIWTMHLEVAGKDWETLAPKRGPGFGPRPGPGGPPGGPPREAQPPAGSPAQGRGGFGLDFKYVHGKLTFEDRNYPDIAVRFKGNSSYMAAPRGLKTPFKIDFNRFAPDGSLRGLTKINLNNNAMDPSQLREAVSYLVFREAGVPAPRTAFVKLYLTVPGKWDHGYVGLYTLVEEVNKSFLKEHFGSAKGLLLKPERLRGLDYLGDDWSAYESRYRPKTTATAAAKKRLIRFAWLVNEADDETFRKEIGSILDVDEFLRFLAVNALLSNFDSFLALGHNYYLYLDPKTDRFSWIPWDLNLSFGTFMMGGTAEQQMDLSIAHPHLGRNRLIERLLAMEEVNRTYRAHLRRLTTTTFAPNKLNPRIEAMEKAIREEVDAEAKAIAAERRPGPGFGGGMFRNQPALKTFVSKRVESVLAQLDGKSKGHVPAMGFGPGGPPGPGGPGGRGFNPWRPLAEAVLGAADTDKDRKLSREEFVAGARRLFAACDKAKKGEIDEKALAEEINTLLPAPPGFGGRPGGPPPGQRPGNFGPGTFLASALIKQADADRDGKLSADEFVRAAGRIFREWDRNKDGSLDTTEITDGIGRLFPGPPGFGPPGGGPRPPRPPAEKDANPGR